MEIFHTSKNPNAVFQKTLIVSLFSYTHNLNRTKKEVFYVKSAQLNSNCQMIEVASKPSKMFRFRYLTLFVSLINLLCHVLYFALIGKVRIIRSDDPLINGLIAITFGKLFRAPVIVAYWGNLRRIRLDTGSPIMKRVFKDVPSEQRLESFVLKNASLVCSENQDNLQAAIQSGCDVKKIREVGLGSAIYSKHLIPPSERHAVDFIPNIGKYSWIVVSRLERVKLVNDMIEVQKILRDFFPQSVLYIVGEGSQKNELQDLILQNSLEENVILTGFLSQERLASIAPLFALQGAPLSGRSLLELALAGLPAVAYDIDWHSELVIPGRSGELVEKGNTKDFAHQIVALFNNESKLLAYSGEILKLATSKIEKDIENSSAILYREFIDSR